MTKTFSFFLLFLLLHNSSFGQQFTQTVTAQNRNCNSGCSVIDIPALNNNAGAIILATPVLVNGVNPNPHPICAYYMYLNKWSIYNLDQTTIAVGANFNVEYYVNPDSNRFVYVVPQHLHINDVSYIDNPGLNNHPNAQVRVFPHVSYSSVTPGNVSNSNDVKVEYDTTVSKWFIANLNNTPVPSASAYNVVFSNGPLNTNPPNSSGGNCNCVIPTSLPPNGPAGGDLSGTYPNPTVKGLQGMPLSNTLPAFGDVLKWNGIAWEPAGDNTANAGATPAKRPSVLYFNQSSDLVMHNSNINSATVPGLENQTFTVAQSSRIVFNSVITVSNDHNGITIYETSPVLVWFVVEILNASNQVVGRSVSATTVYDFTIPTVNSSGIGILTAGTYHTHVTMNRPAGGAPISMFLASGDRLNQGGQIIIAIFPD